MHVLQYVVVRAKNAAQAVQVAEEVAVDQATWSDWSDLGGRWDNIFAERFPNISLTERNILPVATYPEETLTILDTVAKRQSEAFLESRDAIAGNEVAASNIPGHIFGLPVADSVATAQRITESNKQQASEWQRILASNSLDEAREGIRLVTYHVQRIIELLDGRWNPDSAYYDAVHGSCSPKYLREAIPTLARQSQTETNALFIAAIDFHY